MNIISWLLTLTFLVILLSEAIAFHRITICRQKKWTREVEKITARLLDEAPSFSPFLHFCQGSLKLQLKGKL